MRVVMKRRERRREKCWNCPPAVTVTACTDTAVIDQ